MAVAAMRLTLELLRRRWGGAAPPVAAPLPHEAAGEWHAVAEQSFHSREKREQVPVLQVTFAPAP